MSFNQLDIGPILSERRLFRFGDKVTSTPESKEAVRQSGNTLLKWLEEFQSKETHFANAILSEDFGGNGRGLAGDHSRGSGGGGRNGEMDDLIRAQNVGGGDAGTCGADVQGFCELDKFSPGSICRAQEDRHLQTNARGPS
jgi:hypothetical protein